MTLLLISIQGCALSRKQTHLPPFPSGSFDTNHVGFSLFSPELPSTHLSQCFYTAITSAWNVLPSHIPTAHDLISFRCLLIHHLRREIFPDHLSKITSISLPRPFFPFLHGFCYPTYTGHLFSN